MCSFCRGDYEDPDASQQHGFAGKQTVEREIRTTGYADMSVECAEYSCECGETFRSEEELRWHIGEMIVVQARKSNTPLPTMEEISTFWEE